MAHKDLPYSKASDETAREMARRAIHAASCEPAKGEQRETYLVPGGALTVDAWLIETGVGLRWSLRRRGADPEVKTFREAVAMIETLRPGYKPRPVLPLTFDQMAQRRQASKAAQAKAQAAKRQQSGPRAAQFPCE